jgi:hypothetical protein
MPITTFASASPRGSDVPRVPTVDEKLAHAQEVLKEAKVVLEKALCTTLEIDQLVKRLAQLRPLLVVQAVDTEAQKAAKRRLLVGLNVWEQRAQREQEETKKFAKLKVVDEKSVKMLVKVKDKKEERICNRDTELSVLKSREQLASTRFFGTDVFVEYLSQSLRLKDLAGASSVCKAWKEALGEAPVKCQLLALLSGKEGLFLRLRNFHPTPRLRELNLARKKALAVWYPFGERDKLQTVPDRLAAAVLARMKSEQANKDEKEKASTTASSSAVVVLLNKNCA